MMMKFSREQLYKEIWEISAKQVANKYGLNYSVLLKKCKEYEIPLPNVKYWCHKNRGLDSKEYIVELPNSDVKEIVFESQTVEIKEENFKKISDNEVIKKNDTEASIGKNAVTFSFDVEVMRQSLNFLECDKIEDIISVLSTFIIKENKRLHKKVVSYKESVVNWNKGAKALERSYHDIGYQYDTLKPPKFIKEVSSQQLPRLYRLLDVLFSVFEEIGEVVTDDLSIQFGKDIVSFEIIESTDKKNHEITKEEAKRLVKYNDEIKRHSYASKPNIRKYDYVPNGIFRIKMSNGKYIKDSKSEKLENMIPEIVILFYQCYFDIRICREKDEENRRIREEEERKAEIFQERVEREKKRTRELLNTIADYRIANEIREYVDFLKERNKIDKKTIMWMLGKADWIDPSISVEDELLGKREHEKSNEEKENFLKGERYFWWK